MKGTGRLSLRHSVLTPLVLQRAFSAPPAAAAAAAAGCGLQNTLKHLQLKGSVHTLS